MSILKDLAVSLFLTAFFVCPAWADIISLEEWRGHSVLRMSGPIGTGLAKQLTERLPEADVWAHGARILLLDSPGGDVDEALKVSQVLDEFSVHTVVPNGGRCASACGSIIFVAGHYRTVEAFGMIGQHSCSVGGVQDDECNEEIAMHAVANGISHGSIAAFVTYVSPDEILWFSREDVDGWGISRYPGEEAGGFEKSEPRVIQMLTGAPPPAQSAWRLDFFGDGFRAFLRPSSDAERELQLNIFCYESLPGRLFISMEIHGPRESIENALIEVQVLSENYGWKFSDPWILQEDQHVASVVVEVPRDFIIPFLTEMDQLIFNIDYRDPFQPMKATTYLAASRKNLVFAANHCSTADYDLSGIVR